MNNITISNLDDDIKSRLKKRAEKHGHSLEEEAREIIRMALTENHEQPLNLATMIDQRFANLGDFELPEIIREPIRTLTFPVKSLLQAANPHRGRAILTSRATVPGYQ